MSIVLSGTLTAESMPITLAKTLDIDLAVIRTFELAALASREFEFDSDDGTSLKFLFVKAVKASDATQEGEIQYSALDADGADPANGTEWVEFNYLELSFAERALSVANKFFLYNSGNEALTVTVIAAIT